MNFSSNRDPYIVDTVPHHSRMSMVWLWLGLLGAPAAWTAQLLLSEPIAAYACYPYRAPLPAPVWHGLPVMLMTISAACFAVALLSGFAAWMSWQRFVRGCAAKAGEDRNRFLAKLSVVSSFIFIVAIVFNLCAALLVPPCSSWF
ncbi:MAG TPA: hypothetical protein VIF10_01380 [Methylobacter sp.]|jgi:hypothetical protein